MGVLGWLRGPRGARGARGAERVREPEIGTSVEAAGSAGSPAGQAARGSGRAGGWTAVPPVQRVLGAPRTVAEAGFAASLSAHRDPSFGGELGHDVRASAPAGMLHGVLTPLPASGAGTPLGLDLPALRLPVVGRGWCRGCEGHQGLGRWGCGHGS